MSTESSTFCLLPPGKPDPYHIPKEGEPRKRVSFHGQKGDTCWYYALKLLIDNKATPKSEKSDQRTHEKAISLYRKQMTKLTSDYAYSKELANLISSSNPQAPRELRNYSLKLAVEKAEDLEVKAKILPHVTAFLEQQEIQEFDQFLEVQLAQACVKVQTAFLSLFSEFQLPEENPIIQNSILHNTVIDVSSQIYQCKESSWNPDQGVDGLIQQLKQKGPHMINASIGQSFYTTEPKKLSETIEGRSVYGWPPGAYHKTSEKEKLSHSVVLVGAKKDVGGKSYIYFIDPNDPSEPEQPSTQKMYKVSYDRFAGAINNIVGLPFALRDQVERDWPYALHM